VLIPFPTNLLGEYGSRSDPVMLYAFVIGSASLLSWATLRYALSRGHVAPGSEPAARDALRGSLGPALVFYASIPVALLSPLAGQLVWLTLLLEARRQRR
jgi:uncharacterized membrane protein